MIEHFSIRHKLYVSFIITGLMTVCLAYYLSSVTSIINYSYQSIVDTLVPRIDLLQEIKIESQDINISVREFFKQTTHTEAEIDEIKNNLLAKVSKLDQIQNSYLLITNKENNFKEINFLKDEIIVKIVDISLILQKSSDNKQLIALKHELEKNLYDLISASNNAIQQDKLEIVKLTRLNTQKAIDIQKQAYILTLIVILIIFFISYFISFILSKPIITLTNFVKKHK